MGKRETGSSVAAPIFLQFMQNALKDVPPSPFRVPAGVKHVRINAETGRTAMPGDDAVIWEAFVTGTEPNNDDYVLDTNVIAGGNLVDPAIDLYGPENPYSYDMYGYTQFGYEDYDGTYAPHDDSVDIYSIPDPHTSPNGSPHNPAQNRPPLGNKPDSDFSGTGGFY